MTSPYQAKNETIRSTAFGSITGSFVAVGTALANPSRVICFTNTTDADVFFSADGTNSQFIVPAASFKLIDVNANRRNNDYIFAYAAGTQFYVKYSSAPSRGAVYIETIYGAM